MVPSPAVKHTQIKLCHITSDFKACAFFVSVLQHPFYFWNDTSHLYFVFTLFFYDGAEKEGKKNMTLMALNDLLPWQQFSIDLASPHLLLHLPSHSVRSHFFPLCLSLVTLSILGFTCFPSVCRVLSWRLMPCGAMLTFTRFEHTFCSSVPICQIRSTATCLIHKHIYSEFKSEPQAMIQWILWSATA